MAQPVRIPRRTFLGAGVIALLSACSHDGVGVGAPLTRSRA
jgi:hypothetical protein